MTDTIAVCAHLMLRYHPLPAGGGCVRENWRCDTCMRDIGNVRALAAIEQHGNPAPKVVINGLPAGTLLDVGEWDGKTLTMEFEPDAQPDADAKLRKLRAWVETWRLGQAAFDQDANLDIEMRVRCGVRVRCLSEVIAEIDRLLAPAPKPEAELKPDRDAEGIPSPEDVCEEVLGFVDTNEIGPKCDAMGIQVTLRRVLDQRDAEAERLRQENADLRAKLEAAEADTDKWKREWVRSQPAASAPAEGEGDEVLREFVTWATGWSNDEGKLDEGLLALRELCRRELARRAR